MGHFHQSDSQRRTSVRPNANRDSGVVRTLPAPALAVQRLLQVGRRATFLAFQRTAGNQAIQRLLGSSVPLFQRANAADPRLAADQAEALSLAAAAKTEIDALVTAMPASADPLKRNTGQLITARKLKLLPLTPRHDSPVRGPTIHFFPGKNDYSGSFTADPETTHRLSPSRKGLWVRARKHDDINAMLPAAEIEARIVAAASEVAHLEAARPGSPKLFDRYRAHFNALYELPPFNTKATEANLSLDSKGPKTDRARAIFQRIYGEDMEIKTAYDSDKGGTRKLIDIYTGPEGMNRINSPRLQALRAAFFTFSTPVPKAKFAAFKKALEGPSAALDAEDRAAVERSNDWQRLINDHLVEEDKRQEIRDLIMGTVGATAGTDPRLAAFLKDWLLEVSFLGPTGKEKATSGDVIQYRHGLQRLSAKGHLPKGQSNPGLRLFVRGAVAGPTPLSGELKPWARGQDHVVALNTGFRAPSPVPTSGDRVKIEATLLDTDHVTTLDTKSVDVTIKAETSYTEAQAKAAAREDADFFAPGKKGGLLEQMTNLGGVAANVAASVEKGKLKLRPITVRHDSDTYVRAGGRTPEPLDVAWFLGPDYGAFPDANTDIESASIGGFSIRGTPDIVINRTTDVATNTKRPVEQLVEILVHEGVHGLDVTPAGADSTLETYKKEFRAYWMEGRFGQPDKSDCPMGNDKCRPARYDETMVPPGPKSPRARAIFDFIYNSPAYRELKDAYDKNDDGFRPFVDSYLVPDGINLTASPRTDDLRVLVDGWDGKDFPTFKAEVARFLGVGVPPLNGVLTPDDRAELTRSRAWRELVELRVKKKAQQIEIKTMLAIPL